MTFFSELFRDFGVFGTIVSFAFIALLFYSIFFGGKGGEGGKGGSSSNTNPPPSSN